MKALVIEAVQWEHENLAKGLLRGKAVDRIFLYVSPQTFVGDLAQHGLRGLATSKNHQ